MKFATLLTAAASVVTLVSASSHGAGHHVQHHRRSAGRGGKGLQARSFGKAAGAALERRQDATIAAVNYPEGSFNSTGLWFPATAGAPSACGPEYRDASLIIGLPTQFWDVTETSWALSPLCGSYVQVTNTANNKTVIVLVAEASRLSEYTTLSRSAFWHLEPNLEVGMIPISLDFLGATLPEGVTIARPAGVEATSAVETAAVAEATRTPVAVAAPAEEEPTTTAAPAATTSVDNSAAEEAAASAAAASRAAASAQAAAADEAASSSAAAAAARASAAAREASDQADASSRAAAAAASSREAAAAAQASRDAQSSRDQAAAASSRAAAAAAEASSSSRAASQGSSNSGGGQVFTGGVGTFYYQNGVAGHCGTVAAEGDYVIAMDTRMYANGANCGRKIEATRTDNGNKVVATVRDSCPSCNTPTSLDFSVGAFINSGFATESEGLVPISWRFIS